MYFTVTRQKSKRVTWICIFYLFVTTYMYFTVTRQKSKRVTYLNLYFLFSVFVTTTLWLTVLYSTSMPTAVHIYAGSALSATCPLHKWWLCSVSWPVLTADILHTGWQCFVLTHFSINVKRCIDVQPAKRSLSQMLTVICTLTGALCWPSQKQWYKMYLLWVIFQLEQAYTHLGK